MITSSPISKDNEDNKLISHYRSNGYGCEVSSNSRNSSNNSKMDLTAVVLSYCQQSTQYIRALKSCTWFDYIIREKEYKEREGDRGRDIERQTDRQTDRDRERDGEREERETDRETDRERETEGETERQTEQDRQTQTDRQTERDRERDRETDRARQTDTDRQTDADRQSEREGHAERARELTRMKQYLQDLSAFSLTCFFLLSMHYTVR
ncbi:hypothetical protein ACF0H5_002587 [Mactra antiquata]